MSKLSLTLHTFDITSSVASLFLTISILLQIIMIKHSPSLESDINTNLIHCKNLLDYTVIALLIISQSDYICSNL